MMRSRAKAFTLVELLVVIGIIALLISILLPALNKARSQAVAAKCLANEHQVGLAFMMYANDFKGAIVPTFVWGGAGGGYADPFAFLLIQGKYLPDPHISGGTLGPGSSNTVLMCPAVRDLPAYDGTTTPVYTTSSTVGTTDGYYRAVSTVLMPSSLTPPPEPTGNGAGGACIADIGYGVNGATDGNSYGNTPQYLPMQAISYATPAQIAATGHSYFQTPKMSQFRKSSQTVLMFDGSQWNVFATGTNHMWRVVGSRHGSPRKGGVNAATGVGNYYDFSTGICNVLFMDGHAAGILRGALPGEPTSGASGICQQMVGNASQVVDTKATPGGTNAIIWNSQQ